LPFFCHEEIFLCLDKVGELLVTVKPGVKVGLQLVEIVPESTKISPSGIVN